ncbi:MAG: ribonuclease HII [Firmicutes bacterium]|jgi:ribonuclease HII|nr:ribonuclease HII [Bacillota bacterium]NLL88112.1 ribonuclease HII [Bacillota bacterium]
MRDLERELLSKGFHRIAGVDEAGRGPLAGPVVAAAVVMPTGAQITEIKDSKRLSARQRTRLYQEILEVGTVGIGTATSGEIDKLNILQATFLAMRRAVTELAKQIKIDYCIVDGNQPIPHLDIAQSEVVKADASCYLVAAASIIAKVYRDSLMEHYDRYYPQYGFAKHKGYPTKSHIEALGRYGPSPIHRHSFARVKGGLIS